MTSASTRFFGQPRLTRLTFSFVCSCKCTSSNAVKGGCASPFTFHGLYLLSEIHKLQFDSQVLPLQQLDGLLEVIDVFPGHPHLIFLDLALYLQLGFPVER